MGVYYRLMAHKVILPYWADKAGFGNTTILTGGSTDQHNASSSSTTSIPINPILYMDADVVVLTNLNDLWRNVQDDVVDDEGNDINNPNKTVPYVQWSATWPNSGFAIFYLQRMHNFWELVDQLPHIKHTNDQALLAEVHNLFPNVSGTLPKEWDTHMGHGWRPAPHTILTKQERVGMAHFTGKPPEGKSFLDGVGVIKYCHRVKCGDAKESRDQYMKTWGLVDYYIRVPWHYVRYFCDSQIPIGGVGYPLKIELVVT